MRKKVHQPSLTEVFSTAEVPHLFDRAEIQRREAISLAAYATRSSSTRGRLYEEKEHPYRTVFQRDKDRIIHSTAFRRLEYKTQVFVNYEGDYYRTRLTHTIEVSQIARSISRALRLNEDLTEAMALAHDLGHTPFGHCGESTLNGLMADCGGFNHNAQGLRVVGCLEQRYPEFPGLNLSREVLEVFLKHKPMEQFRNAGYIGPAWDAWAQKPIPTVLEAQVVDLSDGIAYNTHDVDDGLKSGYIILEDLKEVEIWRQVMGEVTRRYTNISTSQLHYAAVKQLINMLVTDVIRHSLDRLSDYQPTEENSGKPFLTFSPHMLLHVNQLRSLLTERLYRHHRVLARMDKAQRMLEALFRLYVERPEMLPPEVSAAARTEPLKRVVCDYLAGMTDRSAEKDYKELFMPSS